MSNDMGWTINSWTRILQIMNRYTRIRGAKSGEPRHRPGSPRWGRRVTLVQVMNIYIGNLPYSTDDVQLKEIFESFGAVTTARVIFDRDTGRSKGYGFVEMSDPEDAKKALSELDGSIVGGRTLRVNEALPRNGNGAAAMRH